MFENKILGNVKKILGRHEGGIYKRIDENRELLELLQAEAPDLLSAKPWILGWLESQDGFLCDLVDALPPDDPQFARRNGELGRAFPRTWPATKRGSRHGI